MVAVPIFVIDASTERVPAVLPQQATKFSRIPLAVPVTLEHGTVLRDAAAADALVHVNDWVTSGFRIVVAAYRNVPVAALVVNVPLTELPVITWVKTRIRPATGPVTSKLLVHPGNVDAVAVLLSIMYTRRRSPG